MKNSILCITILVIILCNNLQAQENFPVLKGSYLGQKPPGNKAELFEPKIFDSYLSSVPENVLPFHSAIIFSPDGTEAYWGPMMGNAGTLFSKMVNGKWTFPKKMDFKLDHDGHDPSLSPDGKKLFFLSHQHPTDDIRGRERFWYVEKTSFGWSEAKPLDDVVNNYPTHWTFSIASNGNLYFNSDGVIYLASFDGSKYLTPERMDDVINNDTANACPCVSPDESFLIFTRSLKSSDDLFISFKKANGEWTEAVNMGDNVNTIDEHEMSPRITPDGKYLFFISKTTKAGMFWVSTQFIEDIKAK